MNTNENAKALADGFLNEELARMARDPNETRSTLTLLGDVELAFIETEDDEQPSGDVHYVLPAATKYGKYSRGAKRGRVVA